jgi:hypothetical protein
MRRRIFRHRLALLLVSVALLGCESSLRQRPYADDPLLVRKHPVKGSADSPSLLLAAQVDPAPPPLPPTAFVATSPEPPAPSAKGVVVAQPAVRIKGAAVVQALPTARSTAPAWDHAPDYSWLQGVLERSSSGRWVLRYAEADDLWGGWMILENDGCLASVPTGTGIRVEGAVVAVRSGERVNPVGPTYRVRSVQLMP